MVNKIADGLEAALADVRDGATILVGGFGGSGVPEELIDALIAQGAKDLTIVNNNAGNGEVGIAALFKAGRIRKLICSYPRQVDSHHFQEAYRSGKVELELDFPRAIRLLEMVRVDLARIRADELADAPRLEQRGDPDLAVAGVVVDDGEVARALRDQRVDQL